MKEGLKDLRNSIALSFILVNSMWVAAVFMLQDHQVNQTRLHSPRTSSM